MKTCQLCGKTEKDETAFFWCDIVQGFLCAKCCRLDVHGESSKGRKILEDKNISSKVARLLCQKCQDANEWLKEMHEM